VKKNEFDPLEYIENAFLDNKKPNPVLDVSDPTRPIPTMGDYLSRGPKEPAVAEDSEAAKIKFKRTKMSAPRPRRSEAKKSKIDPTLRDAWETLPKSVSFLMEFYDDSVTAHSYGGEFKESRADLVRRLLDPEITLEETARLLGVCPATVRRYTNRGWLPCHRTQGGQRRFRLSGVVKFVESHGRFPEAKVS